MPESNEPNNSPIVCACGPKTHIGFALSRIVVPLWVLTGAAFKLIDQSPKLLPKNILDVANDLNLNLYAVLFTLIALEFLAIGVMFFLARLARPMAIFMLSSFCLILLGEIAAGNSDCGCLGSFSPSPWVMLAIDGAMLMGVLWFKPGFNPGEPIIRSGAAIVALFWITAGGMTSVFRYMGANQPTIIVQEPLPPSGNGKIPVDDTGNGGGQIEPVMTSLPPYYSPNCDTWNGMKWDDLKIAKWMPTQPQDVNTGRRYIIFFSTTCDHCHDLLQYYFAGDLVVPVTLISVPQTKDGFAPADEAMPNPCEQCTDIIELPIGCDWIITTPIVVALEDGVVKCAKEGEDPIAPECLIFGP